MVSNSSPDVRAVLTRMAPRNHRKHALLGTIIVFAGLTLGAAYAGPFSVFALFAAFLFGGFLHRQMQYLRTKEAYGNALAGFFLGGALAASVIGVFISVTLDISFLNVVMAVALKLIVNIVFVVVMMFMGLLTAMALDRFDIDDRVALAGLVLGVVAFALIQYRIHQIFPTTSTLGTAIKSPSLTAQLRFYQIAGVVSAGTSLAGLVSVLDTGNRLRWALGILVVASVAFGGIGVGQVDASIGYANAAEEVNERTTVELTSMTESEDSVELTLEVTNPTDRTLVLTGVYIRASNSTTAKIANGAGTPLDRKWPVRVQPGTSETITVDVGLSPAQAESLRTARDAGPVRLDIRLSAYLPTDGVVSVSNDFTIRTNCLADNGTFICEQ